MTNTYVVIFLSVSIFGRGYHSRYQNFEFTGLEFELDFELQSVVAIRVNFVGCYDHLRYFANLVSNVFDSQVYFRCARAPC